MGNHQGDENRGIEAKYGHLPNVRLEEFSNWLELNGWNIERNASHRPGAPESLVVARFPDDSIPHLLIRNRNKRGVVGELDILHDVCGLTNQFILGKTKADYSAWLSKPVGSKPKQYSQRQRSSILDYQPQSLRNQYPVPFDIPEDVELSVECRIYFSQHPQEFPEWLETYRTAIT